MTNKTVVLVTCGSEKEAVRIARAVVRARLAACVNIHGAPVRSIYHWKGKMEDAREWLLLMKTTQKRFAALRAEIQKLHSYDLPEIIAIPIASGSAEYLRWVGQSVQ